jgi:hypothetical protein
MIVIPLTGAAAQTVHDRPRNLLVTPVRKLCIRHGIQIVRRRVYDDR